MTEGTVGLGVLIGICTEEELLVVFTTNETKAGGGGSDNRRRSASIISALASPSVRALQWQAPLTRFLFP
jgi:hypothetical protein